MSEAAVAEIRESKWVATPGIHENVPNDDYHSDTAAVSSSRLKPILVSPAHFLVAGSGRETKTKAFGSALHCLLLEPEHFDDRYMVVRSFKKRSKEGQALADLVEQAAGGREVISEIDYIDMQAMVAAAKRHGAIRSVPSPSPASGTAICLATIRSTSTRTKCADRPNACSKR